MDRYAIYYAPEPGPFADFAASWLGWDPALGTERLHPEVEGLPGPVEELTATPRKYGFHGTLKPPFRLAEGTTEADLRVALAALAGRLRPVTLPGLEFHPIGGFLALTPEGDQAGLAALAADVVRALDQFRAPPDAAEVARRNPDRMTDRQRGYLRDWGYPYVMEEFRFHLTLTGNIGPEAAAETAEALRPRLGPLLPRPFVVGSLVLFGQHPDGRFRILHRYPLSS